MQRKMLFYCSQLAHETSNALFSFLKSRRHAGSVPHSALACLFHRFVRITSKRLVRSGAGADALYPPHLGIIRVGYPKVWYRMFNPL